MEKLMEALAKITLGGALTFFFFYSLVITIALIVFISQSNDTPEQVELPTDCQMKRPGGR